MREHDRFPKEVRIKESPTKKITRERVLFCSSDTYIIIKVSSRNKVLLYPVRKEKERKILLTKNRLAAKKKKKTRREHKRRRDDYTEGLSVVMILMPKIFHSSFSLIRLYSTVMLSLFGPVRTPVIMAILLLSVNSPYFAELFSVKALF